MTSRCYSVFVGHLNPETKKHQLRDLFEKCGPVVDIFIRPNERPGGWNYGFVRYFDLEAAKRAIRELHRWELCGSNIIVQLAKDTISKVNAEKEVEEKRAAISRRPRISNSSSDIIEDTMYLARVKETCTTVGLKHSDGEDKIGYLLEDVHKCDPSRNATQWGPLSDPITSFDNVSEKLVSRSLEGGEKGRLLGAKKSQEFMSSLKTIMQEIEDFLSHTAMNVSNNSSMSETNNSIQLLESHESDGNICSDKTATSKAADQVPLLEICKGEENAEIDRQDSVRVYQDRKDLPESFRDLREGDGNIDYFISRNKCNRTCSCKDVSTDKIMTVGNTDCFLSDTESLESDRVISPVIRQVSANVPFDSVTGKDLARPVIQHANKRVNSLDSANLTFSPVVYVKSDYEETDSVPDREIKGPVLQHSNKRVRSLDAANLSFSPIVHVDSEEFGNNVGAETEMNVKDITNSPIASFYLNESPKKENKETDAVAEITSDSCHMLDTEVNPSETNRSLDDAIEYQDLYKGVPENKLDGCVQRRTRSADSDLLKMNSVESNSGVNPCEVKHYYHNPKNLESQYDCTVKPKTLKGAKNQTDFPENRVVEEKLTGALALETLFAKVKPPPMTSVGRSNSRDSSLSEDSVEGVDDSGVESDYFLRSDSNTGYQSSLQDHSDHLKQMLGVGTGVNNDNIHLGQRFQSLKSRLNSGVPKHDSSMRHTGKGTQLAFCNQTPYGRGRGFYLQKPDSG